MTCIRLETRCAKGHIEIPDSGPKMRNGMEIEAEHIFFDMFLTGNVKYNDFSVSLKMRRKGS